MGKERKVIVGLVGIVLLALLAFVMIDAIVAVGVLVIGVLGGAVILRRTADVPIPRRTKSKSADDSPLGLLASTPTSPASAAALLPTWTPPTESVDHTAPDPAIDAPVGDDSSTQSDGPWSDGDTWSEGSTWSSESVSFESNPLDDLDRLDEVDVVAEVERLEARDTVLDEPAPFGTSFDAPFETSFETSFDSAPTEPATSTFESSFLSSINEEVSSPDDIMAASQATELSIATAADDNSELAKLLAKVQQRLAAYE